MKLKNEIYDVLKWVVMIVIPALTTAYVGLAAIWGWPFATEVAKTSAVSSFLKPLYVTVNSGFSSPSLRE